MTNICRLTISRELVSLTFQIEELLRRFNEGVDDSGGSGSGSPSGPGGGIDSLSVSTRRGKTSYDLASELQSCRQRIQEFERRLASMSDGNYIQGLEEKVSYLLNENRRLEDERAEIEEAENDNRLMCQRYAEIYLYSILCLYLFTRLKHFPFHRFISFPLLPRLKHYSKFYALFCGFLLQTGGKAWPAAKEKTSSAKQALRREKMY